MQQQPAQRAVKLIIDRAEVRHFNNGDDDLELMNLIKRDVISGDLEVGQRRPRSFKTLRCFNGRQVVSAVRYCEQLNAENPAGLQGAWVQIYGPKGMTVLARAYFGIA